MTFGEELLAARKEAGLTQGSLSTALGISYATIAGWEQDKSNPTIENLEKLEAHFGRRFNVNPPQDVPEGPIGTAKDEPPKPRRAAAKKKAAPKAGGIPLAVQLELPYKLLGDVARSRGLGATGNVLYAQAPVCAAAWDQFLMRYPALREKLESGMVAQDIIVLIMAHVPIVQVAREEIATIQAQQTQSYDGGLGGNATAA